MNSEFEVGKTYLVFPFSNLTQMKNEWVIGKVIKIEYSPDGCYLYMNIIDSNSIYTISVTNCHIVFVPRTTLGKKDKEIKDKTDLLFTEIDMEELDDSNNYEYTSSCTSSFGVPSSYSP